MNDSVCKALRNKAWWVVSWRHVSPQFLPKPRQVNLGRTTQRNCRSPGFWFPTGFFRVSHGLGPSTSFYLGSPTESWEVPLFYPVWCPMGSPGRGIFSGPRGLSVRCSAQVMSAISKVKKAQGDPPTKKIPSPGMCTRKMSSF